jgi:hypothetical protein
MGDGVGWITHAFRLFDALINPRRRPQPDPPVATLAGESVAPEAPAGDSTAAIVHLKPAPETDEAAPLDQTEIEASPAAPIESPPVQWDDESRRKLIRQLFNEYWTGIEDKPPTFAERLEIAERYINERLADRDVGWSLDAVTRKQLGLPSRV